MLPPDAIDLLVDDHLAAAKIFRQYEKLMDKNGSVTERKAPADKALVAQSGDKIFAMISSSGHFVVNSRPAAGAP